MACGEKSFFIATTNQSVSQVLLAPYGEQPALVKGETWKFLNDSSFTIGSISPVFSTQWSTTSDQVAFPLVNGTRFYAYNCGVLLLDYDLSV